MFIIIAMDMVMYMVMLMGYINEIHLLVMNKVMVIGPTEVTIFFTYKEILENVQKSNIR